MKKTVEYSFPTSINAVKYGFDRIGCYTVELISEDFKSETLVAFATKEQAVEFANDIPLEWHWLYLKYNQQERTI